MDVEGKYTLYAPRDIVYALLLDQTTLSKTIPGCKKLTLIGEDQYEASMDVGIGAVKGIYTGKVTIVDKQPPEQFKMLVEGASARGFLKGEGVIRLAEESDGKTLVNYKGSAEVGGQLAGVGTRMIKPAANTLVNQYFGKLADELEIAGKSAASPALPTPPPPVETEAKVAAGETSEPGAPSGTSTPTAGASIAASSNQPGVAPSPPTPPEPHPSAQTPPLRIGRPEATRPLVKLVRRFRLSDGSIEHEELLAQRITFGLFGAAVLLVLAIAAWLLAQRNDD